MLSRMLSGLMITCVGLVAIFGFFALLGLFSPADVVWLTVGMAVLACVAMVHSLRVRHQLSSHGHEETHRAVNLLRERRGF
jgi:heme exporter protein D